MTAVSANTGEPESDDGLLSWVCQFLSSEATNATTTPDQAFIRILDQCNVAAILLDAQFNCVDSTASADLMIKSGVPFEPRAERLVCSSAPLEFRRAFLYALKLHRAELRVAEPGSDACWQLRLVPLPGPTERLRRVLVLITEDISTDTRVSPRRVRALLCLTPVESELVAELANGMSTRAYAETHSVSIHTVRNQLKSVFLKLGVHSQKDLTAHVMKCCAQVSTHNVISQGQRELQVARS